MAAVALSTALPKPSRRARSITDRPSGVSSRTRTGNSGRHEPLAVDAFDGDELGREAVAEGDGAGLVEEERIDVSGCLHGPAGHGEDVALHQAVHAGDADGGEEAADRGGNEGDEERHEDDDRNVLARNTGRTAAA